LATDPRGAYVASRLLKEGRFGLVIVGQEKKKKGRNGEGMGEKREGRERGGNEPQ